MTLEEAETKAEEAFDMGLIEYEQIKDYTRHLLETHNIINKDVDREGATSIHSNTDKEY